MGRKSAPLKKTDDSTSFAVIGVSAVKIRKTAPEEFLKDPLRRVIFFGSRKGSAGRLLVNPLLLKISENLPADRTSVSQKVRRSLSGKTDIIEISEIPATVQDWGDSLFIKAPVGQPPPQLLFTPVPVGQKTKGYRERIPSSPGHPIPFPPRCSCRTAPMRDRSTRRFRTSSA